MQKRVIYLDNAATTPVDPKYKDVIDEYLYSSYGNAGSPHILGRKSRQAIERARGKVASAIGCEDSKLLFTSSGSEANSLAILGMAEYLKSHNKTHILCSEYEHHSVLNCMNKLSYMGFDVEFLDVSKGRVLPSTLQNKIRPNTGMVSVMYVNNEIGTSNDIRKLSEICHGSGTLLHSDCVQAAGIRLLDVDYLGVDLMTVSGHKIHAPKGVGCLFARNLSYINNLICGGGQEFGLRPGTENVSYIAAFGDAMHNACVNWENNLATSKLLISTFIRELMAITLEHIGETRIMFNQDEFTSKICSIRFDGVDAETLVLMLGDRNVFVSAGAACSSNIMEPSHVLKSIGLSDDQARSTIRVSFSEQNTAEEVAIAAKEIMECVSILKS